MTMQEFLTRVWENLAGRLEGPLNFRFIVQPAMAVILAILDGLSDARAGRAPYLWTIFTDPVHRKELLREGWKAVLKVFVLACILDLVYQLKVLHMFYPGELLLVAFFMAIVPYLLIRGPINRLARPWFKRSVSRRLGKGDGH